MTWTANATGGNGGYTYSWSGDAYGSGSSVSNTYYNSGTKYATVTITSGGQSITRNCSTQVNNNYYYNSLSGYCSATVSGNNVATFTANASGGNGGYYSYQWSGDVYGSGPVISQSFSTSGTKYATVRITDGSGQSVTQTCNVYVGGNNSNVTLVSNGNTPNSGTLASGVYLSDIPYTGVGENLKMILFVLGMTLWSAFMAWVFLKRKAAKSGMTQKELIAQFKKDNLARKGIIA